MTIQRGKALQRAASPARSDDRVWLDRLECESCCRAQLVRVEVERAHKDDFIWACDYCQALNSVRLLNWRTVCVYIGIGAALGLAILWALVRA